MNIGGKAAVTSHIVRKKQPSTSKFSTYAWICMFDASKKIKDNSPTGGENMWITMVKSVKKITLTKQTNNK